MTKKTKKHRAFRESIRAGLQKAGKKFYQLAEGHTPFLNLYYSKAAYDYLIGYQIKEFLDPGYFKRMKRKHEEQRGQKYYMKPGSIIPNFNQ